MPFFCFAYRIQSFPEDFCSGASPGVGASQRGDSSTWGKVPRADTHGDNLIKQDWKPL